MEVKMRGVITDRTVTALYEDFATAQDVVEDLVSMGFQRDQISLIANDATGDYATQFARREVASDDVSASEGASFGAVIGGLVGLGAMLIPGIGPVIAAGPLVAVLIGTGVGAVTGAVTGGLVAGLVDMGVPETEAHYYAEGVRRGGTLVTVNTNDDWVERVADVLESHDPVNVQRSAHVWKERGWSGFDASAQPKALEEDREFYRDFDADEAAENRRRTGVYHDTTR
jgi:hypothetical protein